MDKIDLIREWEGGKVHSLACHEDCLYVGGGDGRIYLYKIVPQTNLAEYTAILMKQSISYLTSKPVTHIQLHITHRKVFCLIGQILHVYDMDTLTKEKSLTEFKNCTCICIEKNANNRVSPILLCLVIQKKKIVILDAQSLEAIRELKSPVSEPIIDMELTKNSICLAYGKKRCLILNVQTGEKQEQRLSNFESLLSNELFEYSCFSRIVGMSESSPDITDQTIASNTAMGIQWLDKLENALSIGVSFPFVCIVSEQTVLVYSLYERTVIDQYALKMKEDETNSNLLLVEDNHRMYIAHGSYIVLLIQRSIEEQICNLIENCRIEEAISLFERTWNGPKKKKELKLRELTKNAAFALLFSARFREAFEQFSKTDVDVLEVLYYFKDLRCPGFSYTPEEDRGDIGQKIKNNGNNTTDAIVSLKLKAAKKMLADYLHLQRKRVDKWSENQKLAIDFALMVLYLKDFNNYERLKILLRDENRLTIQNTSHILKDHAIYMAYLQMSKKDFRGALTTLKHLSENRVKELEIHTDGFDESVELLCEIEDPGLVFEFAKWLFEKNDNLSIVVFTSKLRSTPLHPDNVLQFLEMYPTHLKIRYLEHLIYYEKTPTEKYHTLLVKYYTRCIVRLKPTMILPIPSEFRGRKELEYGILGEMRKKLRHLLFFSNNYNNEDCLGFLTKADLHEETVIVYHKLQRYEQVLAILLYQLGDEDRAERYCINSCKQEGIGAGLDAKIDLQQETVTDVEMMNGETNPLLLLLIRLCLIPYEGEELREEFAIKLLNTHAKRVDPVAVLDLLPDSYPLIRIEKFVRQVLQTSSHHRRHISVMYNLSKVRYMDSRSKLAKYLLKGVVINEGYHCPVCLKPVNIHSSFVIYPTDMKVVHMRCHPSGKGVHKGVL